MMGNLIRNVARPVGHLTIGKLLASGKKLKDYVIDSSGNSTIPPGFLLSKRTPLFKDWSGDKETQKAVIAENYSGAKFKILPFTVSLY